MYSFSSRFHLRFKFVNVHSHGRELLSCDPGIGDTTYRERPYQQERCLRLHDR